MDRRGGRAMIHLAAGTTIHVAAGAMNHPPAHALFRR
jgi:hypothetical protein